MDGNLVRIACAAIAVALLGLIIMRRRQKAE